VACGPIEDDARVFSHHHLDRRASCRHAHLDARPVGQLGAPIPLSITPTWRGCTVITSAAAS
jgi:hypothetical protein